MMGFTQDGQIKPEILQARDSRLKIVTADTRRARADLASSAPPVHPGADGWSSGQSSQLSLSRVSLQNKRG
jgi:hypothetical protein